jgi:hypothetical protein
VEDRVLHAGCDSVIPGRLRGQERMPRKPKLAGKPPRLVVIVDTGASRLQINPTEFSRAVSRSRKQPLDGASVEARGSSMEVSAEKSREMSISRYHAALIENKGRFENRGAASAAPGPPHVVGISRSFGGTREL